MILAKYVYRLTKAFLREEMFLLTVQMRRAAVAVPSNIAEGQGRTGRQEFLHFLSIAHGSLLELETQIQLAQDLGYLGAEDTLDLLARRRFSP